MTVIGTAEVEIRSDGSKFASDAEGQIKGAMGGVTSSVASSAKLIGGALAGAFAVDKVFDFSKQVIGAASDMNETLSKSKNVFGDQAAAIEKWASTSATSFGLSKQAALAATAQYGDMFKQLGFTGEAARSASQNLVKTAADLGSFHNVDPSDVLERIGASLRGEYDSLQQLIPNINAARVEQEALAETHKKSAKDLTASEKATATLNIINKDGANAANDFAETSNGLANRQRILAAQFDDVKAKIGAGLLPVMTALAGFVLDNMLPAFGQVSGVVKTAGGAIGDAATRIGEVIDVIRGGFQNPDAIVNVGGWEGAALRIGAGIAKVRDVVVEVFNRAKEAFDDFLGGFQNADATIGPGVDQFTATFLRIGAVVADVVAFVSEKFGEIVAFTQESWPAVQETIMHVVNVISDVIGVFVAVIEELWSRFGDNILRVASVAFDFIREYISASLEVIRGIITTVLAIINGDWGRAWDGIKQILGGVWDAMFAIVRASLSLFTNALAAGWDVIKLGVRLAWEGVKEIIGAALDYVKFLFLNFTGPGLIIKHWESIKNATGEAFDWVKSKVSGAIDSVKGAIGGLAGIGGNAFDALKNGFRSAINFIIDGWNRLSFTIGGQEVFGQKLPGFTINTPDVQRLAKGGVVRASSGGTMAVIGEGGSDEAVVPLNQGFIAMLVTAMQQAGVGGGAGVMIENFTIMNSKTLQENLDELDRLSPPMVGVV